MDLLDIGVEHVGGDMFVSVPKGDAIFMKVSKKLSETCTVSYQLFHSWIRLYIDVLINLLNPLMMLR